MMALYLQLLFNDMPVEWEFNLFNKDTINLCSYHYQLLYQPNW